MDPARPITSANTSTKRTLPQWMCWVIAACLPAILIHSYYFGWGILWQLLITITTAWLFEGMVLWLRDRPIVATLCDSSATVTAVLLALALPPLAPWWLAVIGSLFAILFGKQLYGGLGHNLFNPAMLGYVVLLVSFPGPMNHWPAPLNGSTARPSFLNTGSTISQLSLYQATKSDDVTQATPLDRLNSRQHQPFPEKTAEPILRTTAEWMLAMSYCLGGLLLLWQGIIQWQIPSGLLGSLLLCSTFGYVSSPELSASPWFHLSSGSTLLGAFFIATDPVTAPASNRGRLLFGILIGLLLWLIRRWGDYPDGMAFAVLLANSCVPWLDRLTLPRIYGE